jgi:hypothetical protein
MQVPEFWKSLLVPSSGQAMEAAGSSKTLVRIYEAAGAEE